MSRGCGRPCISTGPNYTVALGLTSMDGEQTVRVLNVGRLPTRRLLLRLSVERGQIAKNLHNSLRRGRNVL